MRALDFMLLEGAEFAGNQFTPRQAATFFRDLEILGATVSVEGSIHSDENYTDNCTVVIPENVDVFAVLDRIYREKPDETEYDNMARSIWLWWD